MAAAAAAAHRRTGRAGVVLPIAGGVATFAEEGSPFTKVAGLGFGGVPGTAELGEVERAFAARGAPVQVELAHLAEPELGEMLTDRGYRLVGFENVLGRRVGTAHALVPAPGIEVRTIGDGELDAWLDVVAEGVAHPDTEGLPAHEEFPEAVYRNAERDLLAAGVVCYLALRDGGLGVGGGVAQMAGAATAPAHRRRGVQTALLAARLADAATAGCDVAVVTTQPGSRSQQNVQRQGYDLLYTRAVLVKEP
jgi:GNAT superfamily N-acetyltransferase